MARKENVMLTKTIPAAALALLIGLGALTGPAFAEGRGSFSFFFAPKTEKGAERLERRLGALSQLQEARNRARISQRGSDNAAQVSQSGEGNTAAIFQRGRGHTAIVDQQGTGNTLGVFQFGKGTSSSTSQIGDGRTGVLFQGGW
jgi:hypothetical protein